VQRGRYRRSFAFWIADCATSLASWHPLQHVLFAMLFKPSHSALFSASSSCSRGVGARVCHVLALVFTTLAGQLAFGQPYQLKTSSLICGSLPQNGHGSIFTASWLLGMGGAFCRLQSKSHNLLRGKIDLQDSAVFACACHNIIFTIFDNVFYKIFIHGECSIYL